MSAPRRGFFTDAEETVFRRALAHARPDSGRPVCVFGAGLMGQQLLALLRGRGVEPAVFIDNSAHRWRGGQDGLEVISPAVAAARFRDAIVIPASAVPDAMREQCLALGFTRVMSMGDCVRAFGLSRELDFIQSSADAFAALDIWDDDESRAAYRALVRFRATLDERELPPNKTAQHFNQYFTPAFVDDRAMDALADVGAFIGDTYAVLVRATGGNFSHYYGFEPNPENFAQLRAVTNGDPRVSLFNAGVADSSGNTHLRLNASCSQISEQPRDDNEIVNLVSLDEALADRPVTMIKMDVEGYEPQALAGAAQLIKAQAPLLAICVYHCTEHLWSLPLWIKRLRPEYRLRLEHYGPTYAETVCYAIPR